MLNHIIAKPKAENAKWPGGESPVSALMAKAESYALENGKTVVELNAEDPSLIPLYFYYGYQLIDEQLHAEVAAALGLGGVGPDRWKAACREVLARRWVSPKSAVPSAEGTDRRPLFRPGRRCYTGQ